MAMGFNPEACHHGNDSMMCAQCESERHPVPGREPEPQPMQLHQPTLTYQCTNCGVVRHRKLDTCTCGKVECEPPRVIFRRLRSRVAQLEQELARWRNVAAKAANEAINSKAEAERDALREALSPGEI